jgi:hypothetical protein
MTLSQHLFVAALFSIMPMAVQAQLSDGGTPTFTQRIAVPPGVHGMSPNLTIAYGGSNVNGALGYGWSLQAGSLITRCPATIATDGRKIGVVYGIDDKLCLNGQRLVRLDTNGTPVVGIGTNDAAGLGTNAYSEFRTESDSYFRIRAYGYAKGDTTGASGPAFFKVWTKAGQIIEYGASPSADANTNALTTFSGSTVGIVWATARMSDVVGNHIDYKYEQRDVAWGSGSTAGTAGTGHESNLLEVQYSGNKVVFSYSDRPSTSPQDASEAYNKLGKNVSLRRLNSVTTYVNSPNTTALGPAAAAVATETIKLTYDNGPITKRSRLTRIQTCAGAATSTRCLPATTFTYAPGGSDAYVASAAFNQSTLPMQSATGTYGVLVGDFNGDGKTDLIRWSSASPSQNQLLLSNGDGGFTQAANFNITSQPLFSTDGCYVTFVTDIDGDGLADLVRSSAATLSPTGTICPSPAPSLVFRNNGDGTFTQSTYTGPALLRDTGHNFFLLDYDGDGKADLVAAVVGTGHVSQIGVYSLGCGDPSGVCTHVYHGNGDGTFTEVSTNIGAVPVGYGPAPGSDPNLVGRVTDLDGDGLQDVGAIYNGDAHTLQAYGLRSHGDGNFDALSTNACAFPIDFNGDGGADCLDPNLKQLFAYPSSAVANFNLTAAGQELTGTGIGFVVVDVNGDGRADIIRWEDNPANNVVYLSNGDGTFTASTTFNLAGTQLQKSDGSASFLTGDFTGHGNVEILRLQTVGGIASNQLYVKQDPTPPDQLTSVTSASGAATSFYYVPLSNSTPTGSQSASLGPRYLSDKGMANAAAFPTVDLTPSNYVVATMVSDSGVGTSKVATEMAYAGLKADARGRGLLGFREVKRQTAGANGNPLTGDAQYLQRSPYIGMVASKATFNSALNVTSSANMLQKTVNVYCDQTAPGTEAAAISSGFACTTSALVQRPYLLYSTQTGQDLTGVALPASTTQTTVNANADPTLVVVKTTGTVGGVSQTFTKTGTTQYQADITGCSADGITCNWILSRATSTTVESVVPNSLANLTTSAGTAPGATATLGSGATQFASLSVVSFGSATVGAQPTATATLSNTGELPLTLTVPAASSVTGAGFSFVSTTCGATVAPTGSCTITIQFAPTAATSFSGTLTVATGAGSRTASLTGSGLAPSVTFTAAATNWGTIGVASDSGDWPTIVNHSTVPILITAHSAVSGPAGVWSYQGDSTHCQPGITVLQPNASCQTFFGMGGLATVGSYSATDQISYQAVGVAGTTFNVQQLYTFGVATTTATAASLAFGTLAAGSTSASQTFTVVNNASGSPVNIAVAMGGSQPTNFPMSTTCGSTLAASGSCTVTVAFNASTVGSFSAAVNVAMSYPRMQGGQATTYYPTPLSLSVPVSGTGAGAIATLTSAAAQSISWPGSISVSYRNDGSAAMTLTPPTLPTPLGYSQNTCSGIAPGASCSMLVNDTACCYSGITAFTPTGTATPPATTSISYSVTGIVTRFSPASLNFGTINVGSSSSLTATLYNDGSTTADWSHHNAWQSTPGFTIVDSGAGCGAVANGAACTLTVTFTPPSGGTFTSTGIVAPQQNNSENTLTLTGNGNAPTTAFTVVTSTGTSTTFQNTNAYAVTPSSSGVNSTNNGSVILNTNTCTGSIAAGATCLIVFQAPKPDCTADNYTSQAYVTDGGGTALGTVNKSVTSVTRCP